MDVDEILEQLTSLTVAVKAIKAKDQGSTSRRRDDSSDRGRSQRRSGPTNRSRSLSASRRKNPALGFVPKPVKGAPPVPLYQVGFPGGTFTFKAPYTNSCTAVKAGKVVTVKYELTESYETDAKTEDFTHQYVKNGTIYPYEPPKTQREPKSVTFTPGPNGTGPV
uniref:Uncharacterized protein n=1 Tax=Wenling gobies fish astro-like virus TaxID=2116116 RepID=A0A2P1GNZ4_9VIRU|nr:hypothetical protein [Wenling gobies fish astro-like virus]